MAGSAADRWGLRWRVACAVAALLHVLLFWFADVASRVEPADGAAALLSRPPAIEFEIAPAPETGAPPLPSDLAPEPPSGSGPANPSGLRASAAAQRETSALGRADALGPPASESPSTPPSQNEPESASAPESPRAPRVDLAIGDGDWARWIDARKAPDMPARAAPSPRAPRPASTTGGLAEALEAHDREVGLGPAGSVRSAAADAAHTDVAPALGRAIFAVTVLSTGMVEVTLEGSSSESEAWQKVGASMQAALQRKPPSISSARKGVLMRLEVVAEEHWVNGSIARSEGPKLTVLPPKFRAVDEAKEALLRKNPLAVEPEAAPSTVPSLRLQADLPGVFVQGRGKVCSYMVGVTPFGLGLSGGCDPSNIGTKAVRVVATRVLSETML